MTTLTQKVLEFFRLVPATVADAKKNEAVLNGGVVTLRNTGPVDRRQAIENSREMVASDPRLERGIHRFATDLAKPGCKVRVKNNQRAQYIADELFQRLKIVEGLQERIFKTLRDGDLFERIYIDEGRKITSILDFPTLYIRPTNSGSFEYIQAYSAKVIATFPAWEMTHAKYGNWPDTLYGKPLIANSKPALDRGQSGEDDMFVKRATTAGVRYKHTLPNASEADIQAYKEANKDVLSGASLAVADIVTNREVDIEAIQAAEPNGKIDDVKHHIQTALTSLPVPPELVNVPTGDSAEVLKLKLESYNNLVESLIDTWVVPSFITPLLERAWLLQGIDPDSLDYRVLWQYQAILNPADMGKLADAMLRFRAAGFSPDIIAQMTVRYISGVTVDELAQAIEKMAVSQNDTNPDAQLDATAGNNQRSTKAPKTGPKGGNQNVQAKPSQNT